MILFQPKPSEYEEALEYARDSGIGFELTDFMFWPALEDTVIRNKLVKHFDGAPVKVLHGPFADLNFSGGDPLVLKVTQKRITQCCEAATALGVKKMVLHSCFFPLMPKNDPLYPMWSEESAVMLSEMSEKYGITFCIENLLDINPDIILGIMEAANGHPGIRACLDAGHANLAKAPQREWNGKLSPYLSHFHLSDNGGMYDDHIAMGDGTVDWKEFFSTLNPCGGNVDFTVEVNGLARVKKSVEYMKSNGYYNCLIEY